MKRRTKKAEGNPVARAVAAVGGPTKAARLCGVSNAAVHRWMLSGSVTLLRHAIRLSRASGIPIEQFVAEDDDQG
jgi:DNA-binding transcriptional regulator YdaS (Cro superfamily)